MRSSSVEFCELAQWVVVPEWEEGGLVLVKHTFVGPLDFLPSRPVFVRYPIYQVCQDGNISPDRESSNGSSSVSLNKFLPHRLVTYPLSFLLSNPRN